MWNIIKVANKDVSTTSLTSSCCSHFCLWTYSILYFNVYSFDFKWVNFIWNLCYSTLSTPEQSKVITLLSLLLTLNISHLLLLYLLLTLNMYLFSGLDLTFQWLRWIQVPFIYRKDFDQVKHFHEVACTATYLIYSKFLNWSV